MIDKDKSLIKAEKNIFKRFLNFFKSIFKKKEYKTEQSTKVQQLDEDKIEQFADTQEPVKDKISELNGKDEKNKFFKLYSEVKYNNIEMSNLNSKDLLKVNLIIKEEIKLKLEKIANQIGMINKLSQEIEEIKKDYEV